MENKPRVLFLTNIPSPYMLDYLDELSKGCELTAVFERAYDPERPSEWKKGIKGTHGYRSIILQGFPIVVKSKRGGRAYYQTDQAICFQVVKWINKEYDLIISANPCTATGIIAILYMRLTGIRYSIQSEGGFPKGGKGLKERVKHFIMSGADMYFSTCSMDDMYYLRYGAVKERIKRYIFSSIHEAEIPLEPTNDTKRFECRQNLNISCNYERIILSVGRVIPVKGFDVLLKACADLENDTAVYIVGGRENRELAEIIYELNIKNVFFVENVDKNTLKEYYQMADVFVLATREDTWGLVINEAMLYALPVITTNMCIAGNALIADGENGYIVPTNNPERLREAIDCLINDKAKRDIMGRCNYEKVKGITVEHMGRMMLGHIEEYVYGRSQKSYIRS